MRYSVSITLIFVVLFWALAHKTTHEHSGKSRVTIEFWTYAAGGSPERTRKFWSEVAAEFERKYPEARVRLVTDINQGNYVQMISTRAIGGGMPDVMVLDDNMLPTLNVEKLLVPLDSFIARDESYSSNDFPPGMVRDSCVGGADIVTD